MISSLNNGTTFWVLLFVGSMVWTVYEFYRAGLIPRVSNEKNGGKE